MCWKGIYLLGSFIRLHGISLDWTWLQCPFCILQAYHIMPSSNWQSWWILTHSLLELLKLGLWGGNNHCQFVCTCTFHAELLTSESVFEKAEIDSREGVNILFYSSVQYDLNSRDDPSRHPPQKKDRHSFSAILHSRKWYGQSEPTTAARQIWGTAVLLEIRTIIIAVDFTVSKCSKGGGLYISIIETWELIRKSLGWSHANVDLDAIREGRREDGCKDQSLRFWALKRLLPTIRTIVPGLNRSSCICSSFQCPNRGSYLDSLQCLNAKRTSRPVMKGEHWTKLSVEMWEELRSFYNRCRIFGVTFLQNRTKIEWEGLADVRLHPPCGHSSGCDILWVLLVGHCANFWVLPALPSQSEIFQYLRRNWNCYSQMKACDCVHFLVMN